MASKQLSNLFRRTLILSPVIYAARPAFQGFTRTFPATCPALQPRRFYSVETGANLNAQVLPTGLREVLRTPKGLQVKIFYLQCLAQASYLISHKQNAFVVDPRRDVDGYILDAQTEGLTIKGILETHIHADFVSGHYELGKRTNSSIYFGPGTTGRLNFAFQEVKDGELLDFSDDYAIKVLHTPGHTMESVVWLVVDRSEGDRPVYAFTGDTLFIGSCGRPDLVGAIGHTAEEMSERMFYSLKNKINTLPDDVAVFPAHGAGSPCGKDLSSELYSTIGKEKASNPALQFSDVTKFVEYLTEGQPTAPQYFTHDVMTNMQQVEIVADAVKAVKRLSPEKFKEECASGDSFILDTRNGPDFAAGHIPGAVNIPLGSDGGVTVGTGEGNFGIWVGTVVPKDANLYLVNGPSKDVEAILRLGRIGYQPLGLLEGGIDAWNKSTLELNGYNRVDVKRDPGSLQRLLSAGHKLLDVRTPGEYSTNSVKGASNTPMIDLPERLKELDKAESYVCYCASGFRSTIATSLLNKNGFNARDVYGGFAAISTYNPELTVSGEVCPNMKKIAEQL